MYLVNSRRQQGLDDHHDLIEVPALDEAEQQTVHRAAHSLGAADLSRAQPVDD